MLHSQQIFKRFGWVFFSLLFLFGCSSDQSGYFPLEEGHWWEYQETLVIRKESHVRRRIVNNAEPVIIENEKLYVRESQGVDRQFFRKTEEGVFRVIPDQKKSELILPTDQKLNWSLESRLGVIESRTFAREDKILTRPKPIKIDYKIVSTDEAVVVSAGRFKHCLKVVGTGLIAVKVDRRNSTAEIEIESIDWYAPGVGLVKTERTERSKSTFLIQGFYTLELLKYKKN
ncbi:MAG: hypothetical protein AB8D52_11610 [Gammaproteobacteria bacterium]